MAFWSSEKLRFYLPDLISPYNEDQIKHCAYELTMGPEAFITSTKTKKKQTLTPGKPIVIPPGQLAMLLAEEVVAIPDNAIGFISMRFGWKSHGLINVSGFHVDPGFKGRLKFSVYNAGSQDMTISRGDRVFMLWLSDLDQKTNDIYGEAKKDQNEINSENQNKMHGVIASPGQLQSDIGRLRTELRIIETIFTVLITIAISIMVMLFKGYFDYKDDKSKVQSPTTTSTIIDAHGDGKASEEEKIKSDSQPYQNTSQYPSTATTVIGQSNNGAKTLYKASDKPNEQSNSNLPTIDTNNTTSPKPQK
ncbi:MAG: hypothetical protein ABSG67_17260 [Thermoguttaceae bacterium]|jgi:dCTP deaminase